MTIGTGTIGMFIRDLDKLSGRQQVDITVAAMSRVGMHNSARGALEEIGRRHGLHAIDRIADLAKRDLEMQAILKKIETADA